MCVYASKGRLRRGLMMMMMWNPGNELFAQRKTRIRFNFFFPTHDAQLNQQEENAEKMTRKENSNDPTSAAEGGENQITFSVVWFNSLDN